MQLRGFLRSPRICLLSALIIFASISQAYGARVQIAQPQYPDTVKYGSLDTIHVKADVTVGGLMYKSTATGLYGVLAVVLVNWDNKGSTLNGTDVIVTGNPYPCNQFLRTVTLQTSVCAIPCNDPLFTVTVDFAFAATHIPALPLWHLGLYASVLEQPAPGTPENSLPAFEWASFNFTIRVVGIPEATTSLIRTTSATNQMSQSSESTTNLLRLALITGITIVIVIALLLLDSRRRKRQTIQPKQNQPEKSFCIECGSELPEGSAFCNKCGTKQPSGTTINREVTQKRF